MEATRFRLDITTSGLGGFTGYIKPNVSGFVHQLRMSVGLAEEYVLVVTLEDTGVMVLTEGVGTAAAKTWYPRAGTHDEADATTLIHAVTDSGAYDAVGVPIAVGGERLKVVVTAGGNGATAALYVWIVSGLGSYLDCCVGGYKGANYSA